MEWLGNERGAAMPCRHQLVIDRRHEQIGHSERGQAIGDMAVRAGLGQCEAIGAGNDEGLDAGDVAYQCVQW
ncbi:hypothetical protein G6F68_013042 [Rhizopus microsporus]|nr:hypothetical protein G6F68_013042 [Rhizopus microsporus]